MPDLFAIINDVPPEMVDVVANVLETRAAIPSQQEMLDSYLAEIDIPEGASVLEIGCGTGPVCRTLSKLDKVSNVVGVDPSDRLLARAKDLSSDISKISYKPFLRSMMITSYRPTVIPREAGVSVMLAERGPPTGGGRGKIHRRCRGACGGDFLPQPHAK